MNKNLNENKINKIYKMKKGVVLLFAMSLLSLSMAFVFKNSSSSVEILNADGIQFRGMTIEEAKKEAKASGKIIFIDAYTDWCGPCKKMAATSFKDPKVGELFNKKFINLKIEVEKTEDGLTLARAYGVKAYPTLLFIDGDGIIKKSVIGFQTADQLLAVGKSL